MAPARSSRTLLAHALRGLAFGLVAIIVLATCAVGAFALWLRTGSAQALVGRRAAAWIDERIAGRVTVARTSGDLMRELTLDGVELRDQSGHLVARAEEVRLRYDAFGLLLGAVRFSVVAVDGLEVELRQDRDGRWNLARVLAARKEERSSSLLRVSLPAIRVSGAHLRAITQGGRTLELNGCDARAALGVHGPNGHLRLLALDGDARMGPRLGGAKRRSLWLVGEARWRGGAVELERVEARVAPGLTLSADGSLAEGSLLVRRFTLGIVDSRVTGSARLSRSHVDLEVDSLRVMPAELHRLASSLLPRAPVTGSGALRGTIESPSLTLALIGGGGTLDVSGVVDTRARAVRLHARGTSLDATAIFDGGPPLRLTALGDFHFSIARGFRGNGVVHHGSGVYDGVPFERGRATGIFQNRAIDLPNYELDIPGGRITGTGHANLSGGLWLDFVLMVSSPAQLPQVARWKKLLLGLGKVVAMGSVIDGHVARAPNREAEVKFEPRLEHHSIGATLDRTFKHSIPSLFHRIF